MQASMTGHLVLSTLHTNDAPSAVSRLIDMEVEPFLITSSLTLVVGQRLARVPCSKCSEPVEADPKTLELLGLDPDQVDQAGLRSGPGCGFCAQTGYQGRLGLFEVVRVTRKLRELIVGRATEVAVKEEAVAGGMRSMRADGLAKALAGRTTLDDDHTIAEIAAAVLVDGYEVVAASHLDEGLRILESEHPDLILVDLDLPGADPGELLAILRTGARDRPFLVMSTTDDRRTRDLATTSGATGFIAKPISEPSSAARSPPSSSSAPPWSTAPPEPRGPFRQTAGRRCRRRRPGGRRSGSTSGLPGGCRR